MTPEKPQPQASASLTAAMPTLRCLKMRFSVSQAFEVVADLQKRIAERPNIVDQRRRQVLVHASDAEIVRVHPGARGALVEHHQFLAFFETPQWRGERADVHGLGRHVEKMRQQASDLAIEDADELPTFGHREAE
jgi:hypothetical protein